MYHNTSKYHSCVESFEFLFCERETQWAWCLSCMHVSSLFFSRSSLLSFCDYCIWYSVCILYIHSKQCRVQDTAAVQAPFCFEGVGHPALCYLSLRTNRLCGRLPRFRAPGVRSPQHNTSSTSIYMYDMYSSTNPAPLVSVLYQKQYIPTLARVRKRCYDMTTTWNKHPPPLFGIAHLVNRPPLYKVFTCFYASYRMYLIFSEP